MKPETPYSARQQAWARSQKYPVLLSDNGTWQEWELDGEIFWYNRKTDQIKPQA